MSRAMVARGTTAPFVLCGGLSMGPDVTREDLREVEQRIVGQMREWFLGLRHEVAGINERLDVLNGRTRATEVSTGEHGIRLTSLEREIFQPVTGHNSPDRSRQSLTGVPLTLAAVWWLLGVSGSVIAGTWFVLTQVLGYGPAR